MLSKLWRNGILTSTIESYCLPCESHLRSTQDAELHVAKPVHMKALDATSYAEGREEDRIRKVPSGYYCEFCNLLFSTSSRINLHLTDQTHIFNKGNQLLRRVGDTIIAYNNISISEKAWNGFRGTTCVVCNKDFFFENIHKSNKEHILKLIQSKIEFGTGKSIYRKVDDGYQCLTCNEEFLQDSFQSHFDSLGHKTKLDESNIDVTNTILDENENIKFEKQESNKVEPVDVNFNKDIKNPKATNDKKDVEKPKIEKKAKEASKVKTDAKDISKTNTIETEDPYIVDKKLCDALNADSYISDLGQPFCILCETDVKEGKSLHLASDHHRRLLVLHQQRLRNQKESVAKLSSEKESAAKLSSEKNVQDLKSNEEIPEVKTDGYNKDKILDSINEFTKQGLNINFETSVVTCKTCEIDLEFDYEFIIKHLADHKKGEKDKFDLNEYKDEVKNTKLFSEPVVRKKDDASANVESSDAMISYAKKHGLVLKDNVYYCGVCGVNLSASLKQLKDHVSGKGHKNRTRRQSRNETPDRSLAVISRKVPMKDFIEQFHQVENIAFYDIIINLKYCINVLSFFMFTRYGNRLRCQVCRVNLNLHDVDIHKMEHEHREKMQTTMVVTSIPDEFIREVQPAVLHCGYCNLAVSETDINNHLYSTSHKEVKRAMLARLHQYVPQIMHERRQHSNLQALFVHMLTRSMMGHFALFNDDSD